jgi:hypothetical protein
MKNTDYQALNDLKNSAGWKILCEELNIRIKAIEDVLLTPSNDDIFWDMEEIKKLNLLNYKKAERTYLLKLKQLPDELIATKITIQKKD